MCAENECCRRVFVDDVMPYDDIKMAVVEAQDLSDRLTKNDDRLCVPRRGVCIFFFLNKLTFGHSEKRLETTYYDANPFSASQKCLRRRKKFCFLWFFFVGRDPKF